MGLALLVERMTSAGLTLTGPCEAIGKAFGIIRQHYPNLEGCLFFYLPHKRPCIFRGLATPNLQIDPTRGTVDGDVKVAFLLLIGHLRQVFNVDVHEAWLVILEGLVPGLLIPTRVLSS